jgi:hypothetical protein
MSTQESTYLNALTAALVLAVGVTFLMLGRALHGFQIFW